MTEIINFLTSKEIIMVYLVAVIACALYFVIHMIDKFYYQKRKQRQNTKELNRLVEDINYELAKEREDIFVETPEVITGEPIYIEPVLEKMEVEPVIELNEAIAVSEPVIVPVEQTEEIEAVKDEVEVDEVQEQEVPKVIIEEIKTVEVNNQEVVEEETLDYTSVEPDQTEAQAELRRLTEALEQAEEATRNIDLTSYEEMQEKEAIISLEELMKKSKEMYESNELTQYADEGNEPICLEDLERKVKESLEQEEENIQVGVEIPVIEPITSTETLEINEPTIIKSDEPEKFIMDDFYTIKAAEAKNSKTAYQQYRSMPIISPVYGIEKTVTTADLELENTANYEKLDEEIKKTNEFIMTLKELQSNLD